MTKVSLLPHGTQMLPSLQLAARCAMASLGALQDRIAPVRAQSAKLSHLRAVRCHLKNDPQRYDELAPLLLSEIQQQHVTIREQAGQLDEIRRKLSDLEEANEAVRGLHATMQEAHGVERVSQPRAVEAYLAEHCDDGGCDRHRVPAVHSSVARVWEDRKR